MANLSRIKRINEQVKQEVATSIRIDIQDKRANMISVTDVEVVRDLSQAKVLITYLGDTSERTEILKLLGTNASLIRTSLSRSLSLRKVPKLYFFYDDQLEKVTALSALINLAVATDNEIAKRRKDDE